VSVLLVPYFMGERLAGFDLPEATETIDPPLPDADPQRRMAELYRRVADRVADHAHPVVFAGDCVSIIGVLAGLERRGVYPTLVFFDAHGDFNTWETTPSGFIGGMPLAMVTGRGEQTIVSGAGLTPIVDGRVALVGARDLDPGEDIAVETSGIAVSSVHEVMAAIPAYGPLYVHLDADVIDPAEMPAMNYPAPGGPSLAEVAAALGALEATGRVVAFSASCWNPELPGAETAARAVRRLAAPFITAG
jgi:arginase